MGNIIPLNLNITKYKQICCLILREKNKQKSIFINILHWFFLALHSCSFYNHTMVLNKFRISKGWVFRSLLIVFTLIITFAWLNYTPSGLLGKMDAIGYAVCHRIELRSLHLGERSLPLCSRCSGMHLATLFGLLFQFRFGKKVKMPPLKILIVLGIFTLAFGIDGLNSYLHFFPNAIWAYEPHNWLRLITGSGLGLGISTIIFPIINQTLWKNPVDESAIGNWRTFISAIGMILLLDLALLTENPLLLYPLAVLSGLAVLLILTLCYALITTMFLKKENYFSTWKEAWVPILAGFSIAITQTYVIDILRYTFTGTWGGFNL